MTIVLKDFPLPPSFNAMYATNKKTGRRFSTREHTAFILACHDYARIQFRFINKIQERIHQEFTKEPKTRIRIHALFHFEHTKIYKKDGTAKRNDTSNRLKALHDMLGDILLLDDKFFWCGSFDKVAIKKNDKERTTIVIEFIAPSQEPQIEIFKNSEKSTTNDQNVEGNA